MLEFANTGARSLLVVHVAAGVDLEGGCCGNSDILVDGRLVKDISAVVDELLTELLGELVGLATLGRAVVDVVLHEVQQRGVGAVHDENAAADNLAVDSLQAAENDVVVHGKGVLASPVPRRVVDTSLERAERGFDAVSVELAVLGVPEIKLCLQSSLVGLAGNGGLVASAEVHFEVTRKELELLLEQSLLVLGESLESCRVHHHATASGATLSGRRARREVHTSCSGVFLCNIVQPGLAVVL